MSDLQDLIHTTTIKAYERGQMDTEAQVIKILENIKLKAISGETRRVLFMAIAQIKERK